MASFPVPPSPPSRPRRLLFATGVALICATAIYSWITFSGLEALDARVGESRRTLGRLDVLLASTFDAVARERGYLLTGDPEVLGAYQTARAGITAALADVRGMIGADTAQRQRLDGLEQRMSVVLAEMDQALADRQSGAAAS